MHKGAIRPWRVDDLKMLPFPERRRGAASAIENVLTRAKTKLGRCPAVTLESFQPFLDQVDRFGVEYRALGSEGIFPAAEKIREGLSRQGLAETMVARAFALIREASRRSLGMHHHPVQLIGGYTLLRGQLAEMATGEGKTLTALLPAA